MDSDLKMVAIVLGCMFLPMAGLLLWFLIKTIKVRAAKHTSDTKRLYRKHKQKVCALLNVKDVSSFGKLSNEDVELLISLSKDEWKEWDDLLQSAKVIANVKPTLFDDYINEFYPLIADRKSYNASSGRRYAVLNAMTLSELRDLCSENDSSWNHRKEIIEKFQKLEKDYPEGLKYFSSRFQTRSKSEIVIKSKLIKHYQLLFDLNERYLKWEKKQEEFCKEFRIYCREYRRKGGYNTYKLDIKEPQADGSFQDKKVGVVQGYANAFVQFQLSKVKDQCIKNLNKIPEFKEMTRFFVDRVYDEMKGMVQELVNSSNTLVVFITNNKYHWSDEVYEYHYNKLKTRLVDDGVDFCNLEQLPQYCSTSSDYEYVIIFDLITTHDELINNCVLLSNFFAENLPCIGYYSFFKEYSFEELKKIQINESELLTKSKYQKELAFIKKLFNTVNKDEYYFWIAITNVLIDKHHKVKETWLIDAEQYSADVRDKKGFISVTYNTPDSLPDSEFTIIGDMNNLDDVARFTYELFTMMGIYDQFKENAHSIIKHINEHRCLMR